MKSKLGTAAVFFLVVSCIRNYPGGERLLPRGTDATVTLQSQYVSNTSSELVFDAEISWLVNDQFAFYAVSNSLNFTSPGTYTLLDTLEGIETNAQGASSTVILIDESGSYDSADYTNLRSMGISKLCWDTPAPGNFLLGGFSRQGKLLAEPVEYFQQNFGNDPEGQSSFLFGLAERTGGNSSLYDAVNDAVNRLAAANTGTNKKNIVVLAHANDNGSVAPPDSIIAKAVRGGIKINIIFAGNSDTGPTSKLSEATGGLFSACPFSDELITVLGLLHHLLEERGAVSRVRIKYQPSGGSIQPGTETFHTLVVQDSQASYDFPALLFYVKVPN